MADTAKSAMNMTPLRLSVLRFLAERRNGYSIKGLVHELVPRGRNGDLAWTEQGAARMAGKLIAPLREAGLVKDDPSARMYERKATITDAGRARLAEHCGEAPLADKATLPSGPTSEPGQAARCAVACELGNSKPVLDEDLGMPGFGVVFGDERTCRVCGWRLYSDRAAMRSGSVDRWIPPHPAPPAASALSGPSEPAAGRGDPA